MKLSITAIKRPAGTIMVMVAIAVVGILGYSQLPTNLLPDITYPLVKVYVTWRGATPEEIEDNIASVVERKMATVDDLDYLESQSTEGLYTLLVNFDFSANRDIAYQDVFAKMGSVRKQLPKDAEEPLIIKADPSQLPVMDLFITSENMNLVKLRTWVENYLQDQFVSVAGTAGTDVSGGLKREIRIHLHPEKLQGYGITLAKLHENIQHQLGQPNNAKLSELQKPLMEAFDQWVAAVNDGDSKKAASAFMTFMNEFPKLYGATFYYRLAYIKLHKCIDRDEDSS